MTTDDMILIANKAIEELGLTDSQTYYIDGVITMAMLMQENEHGLQMTVSDIDANALLADVRSNARNTFATVIQERDAAISDYNDICEKLNAMTAERNRLLVAYNSVSSELQDAKRELNQLQDKLNAVTRERDALRNQGHSTQDVTTGTVTLTQVPSTGRIHYGPQTGHVEA